MMTWSYRVFREANGDYIIREVFYDEEGAILTCTANGVEPMGRSLEELAADITSFQEALQLPVLTLDDIPAPHPSEDRHPRDRSQNTTLADMMRELVVEPNTHSEHVK